MYLLFLHHLSYIAEIIRLSLAHLVFDTVRTAPKATLFKVIL